MGWFVDGGCVLRLFRFSGYGLRPKVMTIAMSLHMDLHYNGRSSAPNLVFSLCGFNKLYADSYHLVLPHGNKACLGISTSTRPFDFVSLIDIYYKMKCILSKVVDGILEAMDVYNGKEYNCDETSNDHQLWFSNCPFKLDALIFNESKTHLFLSLFFKYISGLKVKFNVRLWNFLLDLCFAEI